MNNDVAFHERHEDELLTLDDVATILMTPVNTVRWWRQVGTGPEFFKIGRRLYTTVGDLRRFIHSRRLASSGGLPQAEGPIEPVRRPPDAAAHADPRHVFLNAYDVMARYGWGKTRGYQHLKDRALAPAPVMTHPDRWRLDQLLTHEEKRIAQADALGVLAAPPPATSTISDLLPQPKRRPRSA